MRQGGGGRAPTQGWAERTEPRHRGSALWGRRRWLGRWVGPVDRVPCGEQARWVGPHSLAWHRGRALGPMQLPARRAGLSGPFTYLARWGRAPGLRMPYGYQARWVGLFGLHAVAWLEVRVRALGPRLARWPGAQGLSGSRARWTACSGARGCPRPAGRVRRRWDVAGGVGGGVGWRSADRQPGGPVASRPRARPGGGLGTTRPDWPGRWGRHGASAADDALRTRPGDGAVGEDTAAVTDGQCAALGVLDNPGGPTDLQRLGRGPTQHRREERHRGLQPHPKSLLAAAVVGQRLRIGAGARVLDWCLGAGVVGGRWCLAAGFEVGVWVVLARVLACDQDSGHGPVTSQPPAGVGV